MQPCLFSQLKTNQINSNIKWNKLVASDAETGAPASHWLFRLRGAWPVTCFVKVSSLQPQLSPSVQLQKVMAQFKAPAEETQQAERIKLRKSAGWSLTREKIRFELQDPTGRCKIIFLIFIVFNFTLTVHEQMCIGIFKRAIHKLISYLPHIVNYVLLMHNILFFLLFYF